MIFAVQIFLKAARFVGWAFMEALPITDRNRSMEKVCKSCPICRHARRKQYGVAFRFVKTIENSICPFWQAYEKVHGRKAHEPVKTFKTLDTKR